MARLPILALLLWLGGQGYLRPITNCDSQQWAMMGPVTTVYDWVSFPPQNEPGRHYFPVSPSQMAHNFHTHVEVTGEVALSKRQHDGDWHIRLFDPGHSVPNSKTRIAGFGIVVAECIPELPCLHPKVGQCVKVRGISRFDGEHKWYEVHPVEHLEVVACRN